MQYINKYTLLGTSYIGPYTLGYLIINHTGCLASLSLGTHIPNPLP